MRIQYHMMPTKKVPKCWWIRLSAQTLHTVSGAALVLSSDIRASLLTGGRASVRAAAGLDEEALQAKLAALRQRGKPRGGRAREVEATPRAEPQVVDGVQPMVNVVPVGKATAPTGVPAWLEEIRADGLSPLERLRVAVRERDAASTPLNVATAAAATDFLNDYFGVGLLAWAQAHTDVGKTAAQKNAWSRGSWTPLSSRGRWRSAPPRPPTRAAATGPRSSPCTFSSGCKSAGGAREQAHACRVESKAGAWMLE